METKVCKKCSETKPIDQFYLPKSGFRLNQCFVCNSEYHKAYRRKYPERLAASNRTYRKKIGREGLTRKVNHTGKKCPIRNCNELREEYKGILGYCRSHAFDIYHKDV